MEWFFFICVMCHYVCHVSYVSWLMKPGKHTNDCLPRQGDKNTEKKIPRQVFEVVAVFK